MKKILALVLAAVMLLGATAFAETLTLDWASAKATLDASGVEGEFVTFDEIAVQMFIPTGMEQYELTDEDKEAGYIGYFEADDGVICVMYVNVNGMSLEEYKAMLPDYGATDIADVIVNDLPGITYTLQNDESDCCALAFATNAGYILEVTIAPLSDENIQIVAPFIFASIQAA